jgi:hypothetical protein
MKSWGKLGGGGRIAMREREREREREGEVSFLASLSVLGENN